MEGFCMSHFSDSWVVLGVDRMCFRDDFLFHVDNLSYLCFEWRMPEIATNQGSLFRQNRHSLLPRFVRTMWGLVLPRLVFFLFFSPSLCPLFRNRETERFNWQAEIKEMKAAFDLIDYDGLGVPVEMREGFKWKEYGVWEVSYFLHIL